MPDVKSLVWQVDGKVTIYDIKHPRVESINYPNDCLKWMFIIGFPSAEGPASIRLIYQPEGSKPHT